MATQSHAGSESVAALRDELVHLTARLDRAERSLVPRRQPRRRGRGGRWLGAALLALLLATMPLGLLAATPFKDLRPGSPHNANIDLAYNAGIVPGCAPDRFCPTDSVTKEQLATMLARTAGLGNHPPVANARTAQTAINAANATTLQGHDLGDFVLNTKQTELDYSFLNAVPSPVFFTEAIITHGYGPVTLVKRPSNAQSFYVLLPLDVPTKLFGERWAVTSIEICYRVEGDTYIDHTELKQGRLGENSDIVSSSTDYRSTVPTCYTLTPETPVPLTMATFLELTGQSTDIDAFIALFSAQLRLVPFD